MKSKNSKSFLQKSSKALLSIAPIAATKINSGWLWNEVKIPECMLLELKQKEK